MFNVMNEMCINCFSDCKNAHVAEGICPILLEKPSIGKIKYFRWIISNKKIRLRDLCKSNNLKLSMLQNMLDRKIEFTYKYYKILKTELEGNGWSDQSLKIYESRFQDYK